MENREFSPRESLEGVFRRWWIIVLMTVLGGIAGWAMHFFRPPLYEATAVMTGTMDFQKRALTQNEQDYAFYAAEAIATSSEVENQIVAEAQIRGLSITINQLQQQMFLERKQSVWEFHIRNRDPKIASELANLWVEKVYEALNAALAHSIQADQLQTQIDNLKSGLSNSGPSISGQDAQITLQNLLDELLQEQQLSQGVISIMKFAISRSAAAPQTPVLYYLANLVLAGACIGFAVSLWVAGNYKGQLHG